MTHATLSQNNAPEEQMRVVRECLNRLAGARDVQRLRDAGLSASAALFAADADYRRELIYSLARYI